MMIPDFLARRNPYVIGALVENHGGDAQLARDLIRLASESGCDAVALRLSTVDDCYTADYLRRPNTLWPERGRTWGDYLRSLELGPGDVGALRDEARGHLDFIAAPLDLKAFQWSEELAPDAFQVEPAVLGHLALLEAMAATRRPLFLVCGRCTELELSNALEALKDSPVVLLHTVHGGAVSLSETALPLMRVLEEKHGLPVGYYGLEPGVVAAAAALALGAKVIEKPFTTDHRLSGPRHASSLDRDELRALVSTLRALAGSLATDGPRVPLPAELGPEESARAALVAGKDLAAGEVLQPEMLLTRLGSYGISPLLQSRLLGRRLAYDVVAGDPVTFGEMHAPD